jgi:hypothetical protein
MIPFTMTSRWQLLVPVVAVEASLINMIKALTLRIKSCSHKLFMNSIVPLAR